MMRRNTVARARVIPVPVPAPAADPDTISDSGSSTSAPPPKPGRKQTNSVLQVLRAGAPVIPAPEHGQPAAVADEEMTSQEEVVEDSASAVVSGTAINNYLRTYGQIPMTRSQGPDLDLNAGLPPPPGAPRPPRQVVDRPVICAYCNCAFCFGAPEIPSLNPGPGHVYRAPPAPITLDLLTPPPVGPLYLPGDRWGPGALPEWLLVCSNEHHFKATMGMLQQRSGRAPSLVWKCTTFCLRVLPIVVGSDDANSPDLLANPAPPPEPWRYPGAYWNYVAPGHEEMVKLKLHDDPLKLTLGRR